MNKFVIDSSLQHLFTSVGDRKVILSNETLPEEILGNAVSAILNQLKIQVHTKASYLTGLRLFEAGSILFCLSLVGNDSILYNYWEAHCDNVNNFEYDVSILLYFDQQISGGEFDFMKDYYLDRVVQISPCRLLLFESSILNIHRVEIVSRYASPLSLVFRRCRIMTWLRKTLLSIKQYYIYGILHLE